MSAVASTTAPARDVATWLRAHRRLLLITHVRPDGDAFGSVVGLLSGLTSAGFDCQGFLGTPLPDRYRDIFPRLPGLLESKPPDLTAVDAVVCLDTANWQRADLPPGLARDTSLPVCNIDHHPDNTGFGHEHWIAPDRTATAQMLTELLDVMGVPVAEATATPLFTGLVTDCGGFRFRNTNAGALRTAADLMERGAAYSAIMNNLFFREPYSKLLLKAHLLENARFAHDNRLLYTVLDEDALEQYGVQPADTENIIDTLRVVDSVDIACLIQPEEGQVRFSFRARSEQARVDRIAHELGGGGHPLAAGARVENISVNEAERLLVRVTERTLS